MHRLKPRHWFIFMLAGIAMLVSGIVMLEGIEELRVRTDKSIAVVADGEWIFTTSAGDEMRVAPPRDCKHRHPQGTGCLERYQIGDEVLLSYDSADPSRVWIANATPGGFWPVILLVGGLFIATIAAILLYFASVLPRVQAALDRVTNRLPQQRRH